MESVAHAIVEDEDEDGPGVRAGQRHRVFAGAAQAPLVALALHGWQWLRGRLAGKAPATPRATLRLVAHLALGGRKTLALVEVEGQRYLVGGGGDTVTAIVAVQVAAQDHWGPSAQDRATGTQVPGECAG
jgi:flagellar biogenesis protein FliO